MLKREMAHFEQESVGLRNATHLHFTDLPFKNLYLRVELTDLEILLLISAIELGLRFHVILHELVELDESIVVRVTLFEDLFNDLFSVILVDMLFLQKSHHLTSVNFAVTVGIKNFKLLPEHLQLVGVHTRLV